MPEKIDKEKTYTSSAGIPLKTKTGQTTKKKKDDDKDKKKKDDKEEKEEIEPWWPPFHFDSRNALKSKLCINLRNCQYDLFRTIAMNELGWRIVDHRNKVVDQELLKLEDEALKAEMLKED